MLIVPVRRPEDAEGGLWCVLGSEPQADAPREWIPEGCVQNRVSAEGSDLTVLVLDEGGLPDRIRERLGLGRKRTSPPAP